MAPKYPSIADPTTDPLSLRDSVLSIKQFLEILTGQRGSGDNAALMPSDLNSAISDATDAISGDVATKVSKSGDTMTGNLTINKNTPSFILNKTAAGQDAVVQGRMASVMRWQVNLGNSNAESGGNAGSNFSIDGFTDGGAYLNTPIFALRNTGLILLAGDPTAALGAATKQYADTKVAKSGDTMTGLLVLSADPTNVLGAVTKQYADTKVLKVGDTMTGPLILNADPSAALGAATKQYVDSRSVAATTQVFLSGSGTYTTPANVKWIEVEMVGGGGGGAGSGTTPGTPGAAGNTTFSTFTANAGIAANGPAGGGGATASGGYFNKTGAAGGNGSGLTNQWGGAGAAGPYGGGGVPGQPNQSAGGAAIANSGAGGGGGGDGATVNSGGGGGCGGFLRGIISAPAASYSYAVGAGGTGGTAGTGGSAGGNGGSGVIIVHEYYG
jgi:hypothetical protein